MQCEGTVHITSDVSQSVRNMSDLLEDHASMTHLISIMSFSITTFLFLPLSLSLQGPAPWMTNLELMK